MTESPRADVPEPGRPEGTDRRRVVIVAGLAALVLVVVAGGFVLLGDGESGRENEDGVRGTLSAAGCTLEVKPGVDNIANHSDFPDPGATSPSWNSDPPTSGPHYGETLVYGAYEDPVELGRVVHNLEHGAAFILYGDEVPEATVARVETFYGAHENGTILAPYPTLGEQIALGAWLADGLPEASSDSGSGVLAKCAEFDEAAFDAFFDAFQFKGPESDIFGPANMRPGDS
jgi:hypothetical protein